MDIFLERFKQNSFHRINILKDLILRYLQLLRKISVLKSYTAITLLVALLSISQSFTGVEIDNLILYRIPHKEIILLSSFLCFIVLFSSKFIKNIDLLVGVLFFTVFYLFLLLIILYYTIPEMDNYPFKFQKGIFIPVHFYIVLFIAFYFLLISKIKNYLYYEKLIGIFFEVIFVHSLCAILLYILFYLNINPGIGIDSGVSGFVYRAHGLQSEPSIFGPIMLAGALYFYNKSTFKCFATILSFILSFSASGVLCAFAVLTYLVFTRMKKIWKVVLFIFAYLIYDLLADSDIYYLVVQRIIDHVQKIILLILNPNSPTEGYVRASEMVKSYHTIFLNQDILEFLFGHGFGSQIYYNSYTSSILPYFMGYWFEGGLFLVMLHFWLLFLIFRQLRGKNEKYFVILLSSFVYWIPNGGGSYYFFYFLAPLLYYSCKYQPTYLGMRRLLKKSKYFR